MTKQEQRQQLLDLISSSLETLSDDGSYVEHIADALLRANYQKASDVRHTMAFRLISETFPAVCGEDSKLTASLAFALGQLVAQLEKEDTF